MVIYHWQLGEDMPYVFGIGTCSFYSQMPLPNRASDSALEEECEASSGCSGNKDSSLQIEDSRE
jgi:hypothetical protein